MSEWEPATEAEVAMRDALRANDQEQYFRILARADVLLPISPDSSSNGEGGWGTWTTEGRTHVLAFTSPSALQECLAGHPGTHRRVPFRDLAGIWPNVDWWLAVNPGLPIEGYLPSWFVTQISRGDVRLPGRTLGARARIEQASARTRAVAQVPLRTVPNQPAPTPIERQRMRADQAGQNVAAANSPVAPAPAPPVVPPPASAPPYPGQAGTYPATPSPVPPPSAPPMPSAVPRREVPMPDVAPPGAFLPTRADRPIHFERSAGRSSFPSGTPGAPPQDNGTPTSGAPTSGAGAVRGRASFPGAASRALFDDSDRKSLDVPGERELFAGLDRGPSARTDLPTRPQNGGAPPSGLPTRPAGGESGLPSRPLAGGELPPRPGESGLPSRPVGGGASGLPSRPVSGGESGLSMRPTSGASGLPSRPVGGESGLASRPLGGEPGLPQRQRAGEPGLPQRPLGGESGLPQRPLGGESGLPQRPFGGEPGLPQRPSGGESGLPQRPLGGESGLPSRPGAGQEPGRDDAGGDPRRYWPRRDPARSLGEIYTEHAEPVIPAAWQPPPDLPLASGPPLPTRQPQTTRPEAEPPAAYRPGGPLPSRPGAEEPGAFRSGEGLPPRPRSGEPLPQRPLSSEPLAQRPGLIDPGSFASGPAAAEEPQPGPSGWAGSAIGRSGLATRGGGDTFRGDSFGGGDEAETGREEAVRGQEGAGQPWRPAEPPAPLPFDRPVLDRPGFSRLDTEAPEVDEAPAAEAAPGASGGAFGEVAAGARSAGFGGSDLDDHPFFSDVSDTSSSWAAERGPFDSRQSADSATRSEPTPSGWAGADQERSAWPGADQQRQEPVQAAWSSADQQRSEPTRSGWSGTEQQRSESTQSGWSSTEQQRSEPTPSNWSSADQQRSEPEQSGWSSGDQQRSAWSGGEEARQEPASSMRSPWPGAEEPQSEPSSFFSGRAEVGRAEVGRSDIGRAEVGRADVGRDEFGRGEAGRAEAGGADFGRDGFGHGDAGRAHVGRDEFGSGNGGFAGGGNEPGATSSFFGAPGEGGRAAEEQRAFFDDEPGAPSFSAFTESRADDPPIRDPYAALADLRSEPEAGEPAQVSFASGVDELAQPHESAGDEKENTGSFFLVGPGREAARVDEEPSPSLRTFFEDGAAERPDFQQDAVQDVSAAADDEPTRVGEPTFSWSSQVDEPTTMYHVEPTREPTLEPVYEPEIVDDAPPVRLHDEIVDAEVVSPAARAAKADPDFRPANTVEQDLFEAVQANSTDRFLSTLLLAKVIIPFWSGGGVVEPANMRTEHMNGLPHLVVFTSQERMQERLGADAQGSWIKFTRLIRHWPPGDQLAFAINPESPAGAVLPGTEVVQLATWATELGLGVDDPDDQPAVEASKPAPEPERRPAYEPPGAGREQVMQKPISPEQLSHYLERNYDRVSGFVHRAGEVQHLRTPDQLYNALGLGYAGSSFKPDAEEAYVLRWISYRGDLYRIPYGGPSHEAMRAMEGWVIERPPFRGNGFAPSETGDVIAEFKVDSARLPHNAELWRVRRDGQQELIARLDADGPAWRRVGS